MPGPVRELRFRSAAYRQIQPAYHHNRHQCIASGKHRMGSAKPFCLFMHVHVGNDRRELLLRPSRPPADHQSDVAATCAMHRLGDMGDDRQPGNVWSTFGSEDFMRVPSPAARITVRQERCVIVRLPGSGWAKGNIVADHGTLLVSNMETFACLAELAKDGKCFEKPERECLQAACQEQDAGQDQQAAHNFFYLAEMGMRNLVRNRMNMPENRAATMKGIPSPSE